MTLESIWMLAGAILVLAATPGPGVFASVAQSLSSGFRSSLDVIAGIVAGDILFLLAAIFGLSAIAKVLGDLFIVVRIAGACYLIFLGWKMWSKGPVAVDISTASGKKGHRQRFLSGLLVTLGNPKVIIFYAGFLPAFLDLGSLTVGDSIIVCGVIAAVLGGVLTAYTYSADRARKAFSSQRATRNLNRGAGTIMVGTGVAIAIAR